MLMLSFLLLGCNGDSHDQGVTIPAEQELYNKNDIVLFGFTSNTFFLERYPKSQVITSKDEFDQIIDDLNGAPVLSKSSSDGINEEVKSGWLNALNSANIDFSKDNLLMFRFTEGRLYDLKITESDIGKDKKLVVSKANPPGSMVAMSNGGLLVIYKIPKSVENIYLEILPTITNNAEKLTVKNRV
jgi:hypothetical protein